MLSNVLYRGKQQGVYLDDTKLVSNHTIKEVELVAWYKTNS